DPPEVDVAAVRLDGGTDRLDGGLDLVLVEHGAPHGAGVLMVARPDGRGPPHPGPTPLGRSVFPMRCSYDAPPCLPGPTRLPGPAASWRARWLGSPGWRPCSSWCWRSP